MSLSIDLGKEGLEMFFKPWQVRVFKALWGSQEGSTSSEVCQAIGENVISRASVIKFLNLMTEEGLLSMDTTSGKGGYYGIYSPRRYESGTKRELAKRIREKAALLEM